jgi:hypothetical protein
MSASNGWLKERSWSGSQRRFCGPILLACIAIAAGAIPSRLRAQSDSSGIFAGALINARDGQPIPFGTIVLVNTKQESFADARGNFRLRSLHPGVYTVRARQIGFSPKDTTITIAPGSLVTGVTLGLTPVALALPGVVVKPGECRYPGPPDSAADPALAGVFAQLRENVNRHRILLDQYPFHYRWEDSLGGINGSPKLVDTTRFESRHLERYRVGGVIYTTIDFEKRRQIQNMYMPEFHDLGDSTFLATHCWSWGGVGRAGNGNTDAMLIIDFTPWAKIHDPDVAGSIYLDSARLVVIRSSVRLTNAIEAYPRLPDLTVVATFREIAPLVPITDSTTTYRPLESWEHPRDTSRLAVVNRGRLLDYKFEGRTPGNIWTSRPVAAISMVNEPPMPSEVRGLLLVRGPVPDSATGSLDFRYARGEDTVDVSIAPYDTARAARLRFKDDTLDMLYTEYSIAFDTLYSLADRNRVKINFYFHRQDDLDLNGHKYRGYAMRWTWKSQDGRRIGCDPSFLTPAPARVGWSCYQETYVLPNGLVRIRAQYNSSEGVARKELSGINNDIVASIVSLNR